MSNKLNVNASRQNLPWTEKYAPASLDQVTDQDQATSLMKKMIANPPESALAMPHLLLYGPPGVGKTSCVDLLARRLFPTEELRRRCVLKLNASDERGIAMMRTKVKRFARFEPPPEAPFVLIVLDECDNLTNDAQDFLRRQMEPDVATAESRKPRYILMCNYVTRVNEPIASRCQHFRFRAVVGAPMRDKLKLVCTKEEYQLEPAVLAEIDRVCNGDVRRALTLLQHTCTLYGDETTIENVADVAGQVPLARAQQFVDACLKHCTFEAVFVAAQETIVLQGYSGEKLLTSIVSLIMAQAPALSASLILQRIAQAEYLLKNSADQFLQVLDVGCYCLDLLNEKNNFQTFRPV